MQVAFYISGNPVHDEVITAMYDGCPFDKGIVQGFNYVESDIAVVFGIYKSRVPVSYPRGAVIKQQHRAGKNVVVLETGYINRGDGLNHHYAAGFNGLNGRADFKNNNMPSDRAEKLGVTLKERRTGNKILLCGQVPQDASVDHIDIGAWLHHARDEIKARTNKEIIFKPHPRAETGPIAGCGYTTKPLIEALDDCFACVTFNSNSAVEAVIEGVPVFCFDDGSMAKSVANRSWRALFDPVLPDRTQWLNDLAYCQWTLREMREGDAWKHLLRGLI